MTRFRPCIDLHSGQVKQIVGGTLSTKETDLKTNFVSTYNAAYYAKLYHNADASGAHVIMLGPGNEEAAREAVATWPNHLQVGGGINDKNAREWIEAGAERVILTSFLFPDGRFSRKRLEAVLSALDNNTSRLVIDLSCRRKDDTWFVAMNKWQAITEFEITKDNIAMLEPCCSEFLVHAADNEGLQQGLDTDLVEKLSQWCSIPVTYAGGARTIEDLDLVRERSNGRVDLTIGSALDIFGGTGTTFEECIEWNKRHSQ